MTQPEIEDLALIGDCRTAAIISRNGGVEWLCWPRFDSSACFAALLGDAGNGTWSLAPAKRVFHGCWHYRGDTMVLETVFDTDDGSFAVIDFMAINQTNSSLVRIVEGRHGAVPVRMNLILRFDYGSQVPWVTRLADKSGIVAIAGPHLVVLRTPVELRGEDLSTGGWAGFSLAAFKANREEPR